MQPYLTSDAVVSFHPSPSGRDWRKRERGTLDDPLGGYALTLVDSLDMLAVMGDYET